MLCLPVDATEKTARAFSVYALLRLVHEMDHKTALWHVSQSVDRRGDPLFDVARQRSELMEWVDANLGAAMEAESGLWCWRHGSS